MHLWAFRFDPSPCANYRINRRSSSFQKGLENENMRTDMKLPCSLVSCKLIYPHCLSPVMVTSPLSPLAKFVCFYLNFIFALRSSNMAGKSRSFSSMIFPLAYSGFPSHVWFRQGSGFNLIFSQAKPTSPHHQSRHRRRDVRATSPQPGGCVWHSSRFDWRLFQCISFVFFCSGKIN